MWLPVGLLAQLLRLRVVLHFRIPQRCTKTTNQTPTALPSLMRRLLSSWMQMTVCGTLQSRR